MRICVYGAASPTIDQTFIDKVESMGKIMVERGHSLVFGGGGNGLMGAVARGVKTSGGKILGVIPKFFDDENIEAVYSNCDELIEPDTMRQRKQIMEDNSDAFIVVPGGIGTFEEFFEILTLKQLCRHEKPIAIYNIDGYYNEIIAALNQAIKKNFVRDDVLDLYFVSENLEEVFKYIEEPPVITKSVNQLKDG